MKGLKPAQTFEGALVRQCAPTLAGIKPGSIFCIKPSAPEGARWKIRQMDERLDPLGLSVRTLLERPGFMIVYVYRRGDMERAVSAAGCRRFLEQTGYPGTGLDELLAHLTHRLETQPEFPHEIGVFLGYPLRDVIGFIENRGQNFTCCGFWKSYSDPAEMQACFACYRTCIHTYVRLFEQGVPLEQLAVPA